MLLKTEPTDYILEKACAGERITPGEALTLYREADFLKVMTTARAVRNRNLNPNTVSYTMFRVVNYTTFCNVDCSFCSFYEPMGSARGVVLSVEQIVAKMREALEIGADQMFLQGGVNPDLPFDYYLTVLRSVKEALGAHIHIRAFSPVELIGMEQQTGRSLREVLRDLKAAGMDSVPGAGAEILTDRMRSLLSPKKASVAEWIRVMETCPRRGSGRQRKHRFRLRGDPGRGDCPPRRDSRASGSNRGLSPFIPWTFQQQTKDFATRPVPPQEYLKVLGIARIFLDNIPHIETSIMVLGAAVGALALHAGADDISSVVIEENVLKSYGLKSETKARDFIRESGFTPVRRDLLYNLREIS